MVGIPRKGRDLHKVTVSAGILSYVKMCHLLQMKEINYVIAKGR